MKSILFVLTLLTFVFSADAVSFKWNSNATKIKFGDVVLNTSGNTATAHLLYLGTDAAFTFDSDPVGSLNSISDSEVDSVSTKTTGSNNQKGTFAAEYYLAQNQGYKYGAILTYTDADDKVWYNISSDIFTVDPELEDNALGIASPFNFSNTVNSTGVEALSAANIGQGWFTIAAPTPDVPEPPVPEPPVPEPPVPEPPVPEPATAGVALLGLAMLFKRRKA